MSIFSSLLLLSKFSVWLYGVCETFQAFFCTLSDVGIFPLPALSCLCRKPSLNISQLSQPPLQTRVYTTDQLWPIFPRVVETFKVSPPGPCILPPHRGKQYYTINFLTSTSYSQSSQSPQCQPVFNYLCFSLCSSSRSDTDLYSNSKGCSFPLFLSLSFPTLVCHAIFTKINLHRKQRPLKNNFNFCCKICSQTAR